MIAISPSFTQREYKWTAWKAILSKKYLVTQYDEDVDRYLIYGYDGPEVHLCFIYKGEVPESVVNSGYSQVQNDADKTDFETNYKAAANAMLVPKDSDGSSLARGKVTKSGWHYQLHCIEFSTSKRAITHSTHEDESAINFSVMKAYKEDGSEITDDAELNQAVKTTLTWEPTHTYDILGAKFYQLVQPTENIRMYSGAAAHIPAAYGGNKRFVTGGFNLKFLPPEAGLDIDGRAPKTVYYDSVNHSGSFTMIFKHPAGHVHDMMLVFELFKE